MDGGAGDDEALVLAGLGLPDRNTVLVNDRVHLCKERHLVRETEGKVVPADLCLVLLGEEGASLYAPARLDGGT